MKKKEFQVVQFQKEEMRPLFVRSPDVGRVVLGLNPKTLANWRSLGVGPEFHLVGGSVYYEFVVLEKYFSQGRVQTTGESAP